MLSAGFFSPGCICISFNKIHCFPSGFILAQFPTFRFLCDVVAGTRWRLTASRRRFARRTCCVAVTRHRLPSLSELVMLQRLYRLELFEAEVELPLLHRMARRRKLPLSLSIFVQVCL